MDVRHADQTAVRMTGGALRIRPGARFPAVAPSDRDLFANFERMRREMDELFGDVLGGGPMSHRGAFSPAVDVYYVADPARAVVRAEIPGVRAAEIELEISGRELIIAGHRRPPDAREERIYHQLEVQ